MSGALSFSEVKHGSDDYLATVRLRDEVLRQPLGLRFDPGELASEKDSFHLVCRKDGVIVGCLVLLPLSGVHLRMRQLAVVEGCQGMGIGRALVEFAEEFARNRGLFEIVLHARESAECFYRKAGYSTMGERFIEVTIPHVEMRKRL